MMDHKKIATWLFICAAAVFLMALIGATTRLTESGLSIVEWKPVAGTLPPMNDADWQKEFDLYKTSPQFKTVNHDMDIAAFKKIFFWEWLHRLWGRLIGLIYAIPLLFFWRRLPEGAKMPALGILGLGFAQGAMGWYMVKSGLVAEPSVSHYRLAAHLMLAFLIYGWLLRFGFSFTLKPEPGAEKFKQLQGFIRATIGAAALTMTWGAFTAGLDAGLLYNTFPTMDGHWLPPELGSVTPVWKSFFTDAAIVQFTHRLLAILTFTKAMVLTFRGLKLSPPPRLKRAFISLGAIAAVQVLLGISTLLTGVNIMLAVAHQAGAMLLLAALVWLLAETGKEKA